MIKILVLILLSICISSCGLFDTFYVSPKSTPYLTQQVKPAYRNTNTIGDVYLSFLSTSEALDICNSKLISIRELQNKNQDM
tara:strand:+ start:11126 stop:11371 length:246 start_codon:yes stop_codon:yes gene_type:complete